MKENFKTIKELPFDMTKLTEFLAKAQAGSLMENQLKIIMNEILITGKSADEIIKER